MRIGIATDHGGFNLKEIVITALISWDYDVVDFGAYQLDHDDDYPDFIIPMAKAVAAGDVQRGIGFCGSGVGASFAANRIPGVRAGLINNVFAAHQGVEDDDMNVLCLGRNVIGPSLACELVKAFLAARFSGSERHMRRLRKLQMVTDEFPINQSIEAASSSEFSDYR